MSAGCMCISHEQERQLTLALCADTNQKRTGTGPTPLLYGCASTALCHACCSSLRCEQARARLLLEPSGEGSEPLREAGEWESECACMAESLREEEKECADCAPDRSLPVRAERSRSLTRRKWPVQQWLGKNRDRGPIATRNCHRARCMQRYPGTGAHERDSNAGLFCVNSISGICLFRDRIRMQQGPINCPA